MLEPPKELDFAANAVIGAALEVHRNLGRGFLEGIYEAALAIELELRGIRFERQSAITVLYKDRHAGEYRVDFLIEGKLLIELKAVEKLLPIHQAQLISYLKAAHLSLGLLVNFNQKWLRDGIQRIVQT